MARSQTNGCGCPQTRRAFLSDLGLGFTGLALGAMLSEDGIARAAESHFRPRAKSVIWIFLSGGYSHVETFDPKPALNKYAGKSIDETPMAYKDIDAVMAAQADLVEIVHTLRQVVCVKG